MACTYRILSSEPQGYIMHCTQCNCYQLAFGVMVMNLQQHEFIELDAHVSYHHNDIPTPEDVYRKSIQLPAFSNHCLMVLNHNELCILYRLFAKAIAAEQTDKLLTELSIPKTTNDTKNG